MLIGTSNSIFKDGYRAEFENSKDISSLTFHGMGAACSIILPFFLSKVDLKDYDFLVIETSINDVLQCSRGTVSHDQIRANLRWACAKAVNAGCKPIMMIMPTLNGVRNRNIADILHREVAAEFQAGYVDGHEFVRTAKLLKPRKLDLFFQDKSHLKPPVGRQVGKLAIAKMKSMKKKALPTVGVDHDFRTIPAAELGDAPLERVNSLMSISCHCMQQGDSVTVDIGRENYLVGLAMNRTESWGHLNLSGGRNASMALQTNYTKRPVSFLAGIRPVPDFAPDPEGRITLKLSSTALFEDLVPAPAGSFAPGPEGANVELMGLILKCPAPPLSRGKALTG
ncbi:hypothetical protein [Palleronia salina]|nr:hypothetical protein [Palleronia salina]